MRLWPWTRLCQPHEHCTASQYFPQISDVALALELLQHYLIYSNIEGDDDNDNDNDNNVGNNNNNGHLFAQKKTDIPELTLDKAQLDILDDKVQALYMG